MLSKIYCSLLVFTFFAITSFAQKTSFSLQATSNYDFLSVDYIEPDPVPSNSGFIQYVISTRNLIEMNQNGKFAGGVLGKFGVSISERLTYRAGFGVQMRRNTFYITRIGLNGFIGINDLNELTGVEFINIDGIQFSSDSLGSSISAYYENRFGFNNNNSSTNQEDVNTFSNTFWHFNIIPLEINYQLIKGKLSIFGNFSLQPVFSINGKWNDRFNYDSENDIYEDLQMGVEVGFQYQIFKSWSIQSSYFRGMTDVYKNVRFHTKWNSIALGIVYQIK